MGLDLGDASQDEGEVDDEHCGGGRGTGEWEDLVAGPDNTSQRGRRESRGNGGQDGGGIREGAWAAKTAEGADPSRSRHREDCRIGQWSGEMVRGIEHAFINLPGNSL